MDIPMDTPDVAITLTRAEALVLFDLLARYSQSERLEPVDQAEQQVLWNLCALLERSLTEPLRPDYVELLAQARAGLRQGGA